jgi:hypothetical protein
VMVEVVAVRAAAARPREDGPALPAQDASVKSLPACVARLVTVVLPLVGTEQMVAFDRKQREASSPNVYGNVRRAMRRIRFRGRFSS